MEGIKKSINSVPNIPTSSENYIHNSSASINITEKYAPVKREVLSATNLQNALRGPPGPAVSLGRFRVTDSSVEAHPSNKSIILHIQVTETSSS